MSKEQHINSIQIMWIFCLSLFVLLLFGTLKIATMTEDMVFGFVLSSIPLAISIMFHYNSYADVLSLAYNYESAIKNIEEIEKQFMKEKDIGLGLEAIHVKEKYQEYVSNKNDLLAKIRVYFANYYSPYKKLLEMLLPYGDYGTVKK